MTDIVDRSTRSRMMAAIRGKDTRPEVLLRSLLHREGLRFRLHHGALPGRPDLVFPRFCAALFVHGCFWHRHRGCRLCTTPASNVEFWQEKFSRNEERDRRKTAELLACGWDVAVVWECALSVSSIGTTVSTAAAWVRRKNRARELVIPWEPFPGDSGGRTPA